MRVNLVYILLLSIGLSACQHKPQYIYNEGYVYGTVYHIVYESPAGKDFQSIINDRLMELNRIFSTFDSCSVISMINNNQPVEPDSLFWHCFYRSMEISEITGGAFDITAGPMVNAWGFGPERRRVMTPEIIDSLRRITGYRKIQVKEGRVVKENQYMKLDMSAIAKGYTCDLIAQLLAQKGCDNYMVEIGGEVVARGKNEKGRVWTIGINQPNEMAFFTSTDIQARVMLPEKALATSGNYRNFYEEDGKKYAHTIDPQSGYPVQHSLLSATVLADNCMDADAFATAFMVLGLEKSIEVSQNIPGIEVYFIFADEEGSNQVYMSEKFINHLKK